MKRRRFVQRTVRKDNTVKIYGRYYEPDIPLPTPMVGEKIWFGTYQPHESRFVYEMDSPTVSGTFYRQWWHATELKEGEIPLG